MSNNLYIPTDAARRLFDSFEAMTAEDAWSTRLDLRGGHNEAREGLDPAEVFAFAAYGEHATPQRLERITQMLHILLSTAEKRRPVLTFGGEVNLIVTHCYPSGRGVAYGLASATVGGAGIEYERRIENPDVVRRFIYYGSAENDDYPRIEPTEVESGDIYSFYGEGEVFLEQGKVFSDESYVTKTSHVQGLWEGVDASLPVIDGVDSLLSFLDQSSQARQNKEKIIIALRSIAAGVVEDRYDADNELLNRLTGRSHPYRETRDIFDTEFDQDTEDTIKALGAILL